jgi:tetratricopeptide (TPR) repeat protein
VPPRSAAWRYRLGQILVAREIRGDPETGFKVAADRADETGMDSAVAGPLVLARHDLARGRPDRALAALNDVTGSELECGEFWTLRATALYEIGDASEAVEAAHRGLEHDPDSFELLDVLALAQLASGRKKEARKTIDGALLLYPDSAVLHAHRASILARLAERPFRVTSYKKARNAVEEALRLDPECEAALRARAHIAALSGDRNADAYAAELLASDPENEYAHVISGTARAHRGDVRPALDHFLEAARLNPSNPNLARLGRRSRVLQTNFAAPLLFMERVTHGHVRLGWIGVIVLTRLAHQTVLSVAAVIFWVYMWSAHIYIERRTGKAPK